MQHTNKDSSCCHGWPVTPRENEPGRRGVKKLKLKKRKQACDEEGNKARESGPASVNPLT